MSMKNFLRWELPAGADLIKYARRHPDLIRVKYQDTLVKLNYSKHTQAKAIWNPYTAASRGIIIDAESGKVLVYPFRKFFNKFEYEKYGIPIPNLPYEVTLKYDGVMIIPYLYEGALHLSTRGDFQSAFITKADAVRYFDWLDCDHFTFMFELVSPSFSRARSRQGLLVTRYEADDLILVGMRDKRTGALLMPSQVIAYAQDHDLHHFTLVPHSLPQILGTEQRKATPTLEEGWVVHYQNGLLLKIKRLEYLTYFFAISGLTKKRVLRALVQGKYAALRETTPEELVDALDEIRDPIVAMRDAFVEQVIQDFTAIPEEVRNDRRQFFLLIKGYKRYKKSKKKNKAYASALKIYYTKRSREALHQHFYRYVYPGRLWNPK